MYRTTINSDGTISYRTRLLRPRQAVAFAECLRANKGRFCDVTVQESRKRNGRYYVRFRPAKRGRQLDLFQEQWDARHTRAFLEGEQYIFWPDPDHLGDYWCMNTVSGESYQVNGFRCTCPDWVYRCDKAGIQCKHQQAWELQAQSCQ